MVLDVRGVTPLLQVYDMLTSIRFYRDKLGCTVKMTSPALGGEELFHWVLLELGKAEFMLNTAYEFDDDCLVPRDPARSAAHDDVCLYFSRPNVDAAYAELGSRGVEVNPPTIAPYGMKQMYLHDPDGIGICFQWAANA